MFIYSKYKFTFRREKTNLDEKTKKTKKNMETLKNFLKSFFLEKWFRIVL